MQSAFEQCIECVLIANSATSSLQQQGGPGDGTSQPLHAKYTQTETTIASAAELISKAVFQAHQDQCVSRLASLVQFIDSLHSCSSNQKFVSLNKLLRNIAIDGRYRKILKLMTSRDHVSVVDVIEHLCDLHWIRDFGSGIFLKLAQLNRNRSRDLLKTARSCVCGVILSIF